MCFPVHIIFSYIVCTSIMDVYLVVLYCWEEQAGTTRLVDDGDRAGL